MRYHVSEKEVNGLKALCLFDAERRAEAVVYPELGFNCAEFRTTPEAGSEEAVELLIPPPDPAMLREAPVHRGLPVLFPFPNRVREGKYSFEGRDYSMEKLMAAGRDHGAGQAIHGLVLDKPWGVEETAADQNSAFVRGSIQLDAWPDIYKQYPFACRLTVTYRLAGGVLEMDTTVSNTGETTLPMGFGIHPWFPAALQPGVKLTEGLTHITAERRAACEVQVPAKAIWELDKLMPTGKVQAPAEAGEEFDMAAHRRLEGNFYDHVFTEVLKNEEGWSEGGMRDHATGLEMFMAADAAFREWVLYAPLKEPVIALEPYTCTTDAVNLQAQGLEAGLVALPPGHTWRGVIRIGLRRFTA